MTQLIKTENLDKSSCPICGSDIIISNLPSGITSSFLNQLLAYRNAGVIQDVFSIAEISMRSFEPKHIQLNHMVQQEINDVRTLFKSMTREINENQIHLINEIRCSDDTKFKEIFKIHLEKFIEKGDEHQERIHAKLDSLRDLDTERFKDYNSLVKSISEIQKRLSGPGIGQAGEIITLLDLKKVCPSDNFSDEKSKSGGTDIIASIQNKGEKCGKISISVKYEKRWLQAFIDQLIRNMDDDETHWGILVTKVFPREALNQTFHHINDNQGHNILVIKPEVSPLAYFVARHAVIYLHEIEKASQARLISQERGEQIQDAIDKWLAGDQFKNTIKNILAAQDELNRIATTTDNMKENLNNNIRRINNYRNKTLNFIVNTYTNLEDLQKLIYERAQIGNN